MGAPRISQAAVGSAATYRGRMTDDSLVDRLGLIEKQPLAERTEAYQSLHDELARTLERAPESEA